MLAHGNSITYTQFVDHIWNPRIICSSVCWRVEQCHQAFCFCHKLRTGRRTNGIFCIFSVLLFSYRCTRAPAHGHRDESPSLSRCLYYCSVSWRAASRRDEAYSNRNCIDSAAYAIVWNSMNRSSFRVSYGNLKEYGSTGKRHNSYKDRW